MLSVRKNQFLSGMHLPEVSSEERWNIDKTVMSRRIVMPDVMEHVGHKHGGRWLREAAYLLAEDMLANQGVQVHKEWDTEFERWYLTYVVKYGTPDKWRMLP